MSNTVSRSSVVYLTPCPQGLCKLDAVGDAYVVVSHGEGIWCVQHRVAFFGGLSRAGSSDQK